MLSACASSSGETQPPRALTGLSVLLPGALNHVRTLAGQKLGSETIAVGMPLNGEIVFLNQNLQQIMNGGFGQPRGMAADGAGDIYVALAELPGIAEFPPNSSQPTRILTMQPNETPLDVAICPNGTVYAAQQESSSPYLGSIAVFAGGSTTPTSELTPWSGFVAAVACDNRDRLYAGGEPSFSPAEIAVYHKDGSGPPTILPMSPPDSISCLKVLRGGTIVTASYAIGGDPGAIEFYRNSSSKEPFKTITTVPEPGYFAFDAYARDRMYVTSESDSHGQLLVVSRSSGKVVNGVYLGDGFPTAFGVAVATSST